MFSNNTVLENCWEKNLRDKNVLDQTFAYENKQVFFGDNKIEIRASEDGLVIGLTMMPLVNKGDALLHIASQKNQIYDEKFLVNDNINLTLD